MAGGSVTRCPYYNIGTNPLSLNGCSEVKSTITLPLYYRTGGEAYA